MPIITCAGRRDSEYVAGLLAAGGTVVGACPGRNTTGDAPDDVHIARFEGCVLGTFERNGYDDSDFVAVVWSEKAQAVISIEYATTRGWTYHNGATVDATDEVKAKAATSLADDGIERWRMADLAAAVDPAVGKCVQVVKGRKVPIGTIGTVGWVGADQYYRTYGGPGKRRIRIDTEDGQRLFIALGNVEVIDPGQYLASEAEITAKRAEFEAGVLRHGNFVGPYRSVEAELLHGFGFVDTPHLTDEQAAELEAERGAERRLLGVEA